MDGTAGEWIDAAHAAERLGVKTATLYAYVSRGVLRRRRSPDGRRSLFDPGEIEELARRGRPRRATGPPELVIESQLTALGEDRPYYRGRDAVRLAGAGARFEEVAHWLWTGEDAGAGEWRASPEAVEGARAAQSGLPAATLPLERLQIITVALGTADPLRLTLDTAAVVAAGRNLIAGMVESLPPEAPAPRAASIPARLWSRLTAAEPRPELVDVLRAALVLFADHELAASTLAVRVAASVRADPYAAVGAGLGVFGGPLHGGASLGAETVLAEIEDPAQARRVIGERLRRGDRIPGAGGRLYPRGDGRAAFLLEILRTAAPGHPRLAALDAVLAETGAYGLPGPSAEFVLAGLTAVTGMAKGAGEAIFAIARTAGWLAHAIEEYARDSPLRPRAVYTGPPPGRQGRSA